MCVPCFQVTSSSPNYTAWLEGTLGFISSSPSVVASQTEANTFALVQSVIGSSVTDVIVSHVPVCYRRSRPCFFLSPASVLVLVCLLFLGWC